MATPAFTRITTGLPRLSTALPPPSTNLEHLSVEDGLAHSVEVAISQDHPCLLWSATRDGLDRHDGHLFTKLVEAYLPEERIVDRR